MFDRDNDPRLTEADRAIHIAEGLEEHAADLLDQAEAERQRARRIRSQVFREPVTSDPRTPRFHHDDEPYPPTSIPRDLSGPRPCAAGYSLAELRDFIERAEIKEQLRRVADKLTPEAEALRDGDDLARRALSVPRTPAEPNDPRNLADVIAAIAPPSEADAADTAFLNDEITAQEWAERVLGNPRVPVKAVPPTPEHVMQAHRDRWCTCGAKTIQRRGHASDCPHRTGIVPREPAPRATGGPIMRDAQGPSDQTLASLRRDATVQTDSAEEFIAELDTAESVQADRVAEDFTGCFPPCEPGQCVGCDEQRKRIDADHAREAGILAAEIERCTEAIDRARRNEKSAAELGMPASAQMYESIADTYRRKRARLRDELQELRAERDA